MINLILLFWSLFPQQNIDSTIIEMQKKFESISTFKAEFVQTANSKSIMQGQFYFSKNDNYRIELKSNTIISDGNSIWNIDNTRKKVIISNIEEDPLAFSLRDYIYEYPQKCKVTSEKMDKNITIVNLQADDDGLNFKNAKLWISQDYLITKIQFSDYGGNEFHVHF